MGEEVSYEVSWDLEANGYRLPTEAEWEYAARAPVEGVSRYPLSSGWAGTASTLEALAAAPICVYGNFSDASANAAWPDWTIFSCQDGRAGPASTGSFQPNAWGLYDMSGNVWEWIFDVYRSDYEALPGLDPVNAGGGSSRVLRGGSWGDYLRDARVARRGGVSPGDRWNSLGLRLTRSVE